MAWHTSYHIQHFPPTNPWPRGGWALYNISGDEIADRIGPISTATGSRHRDSWCGYLGIRETMAEIAALVDQHKAWVDYANAETESGRNCVVAFNEWNRRAPR